MKKILLNIGGVLLLFGLWAYQYHTRPAHQTPAKANANLINIEPWYSYYNEKYFDRQLSDHIQFSWGHATTYDHNGKPTDNLGVTNGDAADAVTIQLNPFYLTSANFQRLVLLHEMCHVKTWRDDPQHDHAAEWRGCMHELAVKGAFDDIW